MVVSLFAVSKSFGSVQAVRDITLAVAPGEFTVLLGPSGSGKTTILRMIAGLEDVSAGRVEIGGRDVTHLPPKSRDVAMVFQSYALYPHMTVAGNIGYPLKLRRVPRTERDAQIRQAAERVHIEPLLHRYPSELSGGQQQRVAFARAIVRRPSVFLLDEPLSSLDPTLRAQLRSELKRLQTDLNVTTLYVTHDQVEAMTLAHRIAIIDRGGLVQIGTPRAVYENPADLFVAGFVGSPPMNLLRGAVSEGMFVHECGRVPTALGGRSTPRAILGVRPEACRIANDAELRGEVFTTELMGDYTLTTVSLAGDTIVIKTPRDFVAVPRTPIGIGVSPGDVLLFDARSGARIR